MVKAGKTLNPADKARKEARKKELKKNKKQRHQVRSAAIESKDPEQIIADLEKLDGLEFDAATNPSFSDTLFKDKRKKLKETWNKILAYYAREDPERHTKLQKIEIDYENRYKKLVREFESIKAAQELKIEDVFLPPEASSAIDNISEDDPLMSESLYVTPFTEGVKPPGCPPGLPPSMKLLVDSLSSSIACLPITDQPLPPNLRNLHLPQSSNFNQKNPPRDKQRVEYGSGRSTKPPHQSIQVQPGIETINNTKSSKQPVAQRKQVGTGFKPVTLKPKANMFVPSSVRSKIRKD